MVGEALNHAAGAHGHEVARGVGADHDRVPALHGHVVEPDQPHGLLDLKVRDAATRQRLEVHDPFGDGGEQNSVLVLRLHRANAHALELGAQVVAVRQVGDHRHRAGHRRAPRRLRWRDAATRSGRAERDDAGAQRPSSLR